MSTANQNPEQIARDRIDAKLEQAGWQVQAFKVFAPHAALGIAVREYQTDVGPVDYALFVDGQLCGVIEAKRDEKGYQLTGSVAEQSQGYASAQFKYLSADAQVHFIYEATGEITRFTDSRDPKPRSREVFSFHRPESLQEWLKQGDSLRNRLQALPQLSPENLRDCQISAITELEQSFKDNKPRALIQMATGAGKTFTAATFIYRLLKHAGAKRVLFLVDTKNLGEQARDEFSKYTPNDDNRKFDELYVTTRLNSSHVPTDAQVCISTIQRLYSILKGEEIDATADDINPNEIQQPSKGPLPVIYNEKVPLEFFDFIVIDECHRSIYNLWRQVLEYFDGFLIGLTATPDSRTYGFFQENVVSEYTHEQAVVDGVNVAGEVFRIRTEITEQGSNIKAQRQVLKRHKLTRAKRWQQQDEDEQYSGKALDRSVVNPSQIRTVVRTFKDSLPQMFPSRPLGDNGEYQVPKTLIFAKTDSHADDIIQTVREEFGAGNEFCKKVTYQSVEDPKSVLNSFRNDYLPRIAVTVDMIATGTDVKPLECLLFMRDVKSKNYYEQMKGRGTRVADGEKMIAANGLGAKAKTHYVLVDAVGVTESIKTDNRPLETKPSVATKDLLTGIMLGGSSDDDAVASAAGRLAKIERRLDDEQKERLEQAIANNGFAGRSLKDLAKGLLDAIDPDSIDSAIRNNPNRENSGTVTSLEQEAERKQRLHQAIKPLSMPLIELITDIQREHEQTIDEDNLDSVIDADWSQEAEEKNQAIVSEFQSWLEQNRDQITALSIFYSQPARRKTVTFKMIKGLLATLKANKPNLAPVRVWQAYAQLDAIKHKAAPEKELAALVALVRRACGIDAKLNPYSDTVNQRFANWVWQRQQGDGHKFTEQQMEWLHMIREHIAQSFHFERDDCELNPFNSKGGLGGFYQAFGDEMDSVIDELNEVLAA